MGRVTRMISRQRGTERRKPGNGGGSGCERKGEKRRGSWGGEEWSFKLPPHATPKEGWHTLNN